MGYKLFLSCLLQHLFLSCFTSTDIASFSAQLNVPQWRLCAGAPVVEWSERISTYLRSIPNNVTLPDMVIENRFGSLEIEPAHLYGLGTLWTFKPYHTYCAGKESFIEVPAFAHEPLVAEMNWKMCGGGSGQLGIKTRAMQLRLLFRVLPTGETPTGLVLFRIHADVLQDSELYFTGVNNGVKKIADYASFLMAHHVENLWRILFRLDGQFLVSSHPPEQN